MTVWHQNFNPLGNTWLSTAAAALPVCILLYFLAIRRIAAWRAALYGFIACVAIAIAVFRMPATMVAGAVADGLVFGWFRIAWIVVGAVFVYDIAVESGRFALVKQSIGDISEDRRLQVLLIAFAFGALLEGAGGGGAPVAVTGAMMVGLGFPPFQSALMCLIANSAPVAYGSLGNPVRTLVAVTGMPEADFSAMLGRILPFTTLILPFWLVAVLCGVEEMFAVWPGLLAGGLVFASVQFFWSNFMDAALVDIIGGLVTLLALAFFFHRVWRPAKPWRYPGEAGAGARAGLKAGQILMGWSPFIMLAIAVIIWGLPSVSTALDKFSWHAPVPGLHLQVVRMPPVVPEPHAEPALFDASWLATPGTAAFLVGLIAGPLFGLSIRRTWQVFMQSLWRLRLGLVTIMAMLAIGYVTRYCGMDATMGMAMSHTGVMFPLFGTVIGWLGVALSGTDAGSNALFGSLQVITANQLHLSPVLMASANSAGGVMGKMIAAQSLVIGCAITGEEGKEGDLFRAVLKHSVGLMLIVGIIVMLYAYAFPGAIPNGHHYWK
jgi:lactate permease